MFKYRRTIDNFQVSKINDLQKLNGKKSNIVEITFWANKLISLFPEKMYSELSNEFSLLPFSSCEFISRIANRRIVDR